MQSYSIREIKLKSESFASLNEEPDSFPSFVSLLYCLYCLELDIMHDA